MTRLLTVCSVFWTIIGIGQSVSTKLEFDEEKKPSSQESNTSKEDEDLEVKHTIVVSTKLKNNNRRGLHNSDGDNNAQTFSIGHASNSKTEDSDDVPVITGYKSVESTLIRTPDTRVKPPVFTNPVYISRNTPYEYHTYPVASNPSQWKPSSFFNNVNWWDDGNARSFNNFNRRDWLSSGNQKFHRRVSDDGVKEFYCRKCSEMSNGPDSKGCLQQRSNSWFYESTTPKVKIDGKLAKLK